MTDYSIARLERCMAAIRTYIEAEAKSAQSVLDRTSEFWQAEFAARPNYPSVSNYLAFRREGFTHGMADGVSFDLADARKQNLEKEQAHARRTCEIFRQSADPARIAAIDEAALGAPFIFENHGIHRSASFWVNAVTALRVQDLLEAHGPKARPLNILEIGAGWGCVAHQLHQLLNVNSYAIIDLPQNLFLSTTYLSSTRGLALVFAEGAERSVTAGPKSLICAVPGAAARIGQRFDVVVNSFSLQEMDLATVQGYFTWVAQTLSDDGVFLSFNAHGKAGVRAPSEYPLEKFRLVHLGMFRAYPSGLLNTVPYEMVLSRLGAGAPIDPMLLDTLCCLMQFGLGDDLQPVCDQLVRDGMSENFEQVLRDLSGYFSPSAATRASALAKTVAGLPPGLHAYLTGMDAFARGDRNTAQGAFQTALASGLKGFARLRASAQLAILTKQKTLPEWTENFDARLAYPELAQMLDEADPSPFTVQFERIVSVDLPNLHTGPG